MPKAVEMELKPSLEIHRGTALFEGVALACPGSATDVIGGVRRVLPRTWQTPQLGAEHVVPWAVCWAVVIPRRPPDVPLMSPRMSPWSRYPARYAGLGRPSWDPDRPSSIQI